MGTEYEIKQGNAKQRLKKEREEWDRFLKDGKNNFESRLPQIQYCGQVPLFCPASAYTAPGTDKDQFRKSKKNRMRCIHI